MKYIFTFLLALCATFAFGQTETIDFETAGVGSDWTWIASDVNPTFTVINNPQKTGINMSDKVVEFIAKTTDHNWALAHSEGIGEFTFDATNNSVKIKVYKPTISDVAIKFEGTSPAIELKVPNTLTNQWEELTFDFSSVNGNTFNKIIIIPDFVAPHVTGKDRTTDNTLYFDDIITPEGVTSTDPAPDDAPAAPTESADDVLSLFSDAYTDVSATWNPSWGQSTAVTDEVIASNNLKKYKSFNFSGIEPSATITKSNYGSIKIDYWTPDAANIKVKFRDYGANNVYDGGDDLEQELVHSVTTTSSWQTIQIDLGDYTSLTAGNIGQIILSSATSEGGNSLVYFDNIYFSKTTLSVDKLSKSGVSFYPNPFANHIEIKAAQVVNQVRVFNITGQEILRDTPNKAHFTLDTTHLSKGVYLLSLESNGKSTTAKMVK